MRNQTKTKTQKEEEEKEDEEEEEESSSVQRKGKVREKVKEKVTYDDERAQEQRNKDTGNTAHPPIYPHTHEENINKFRKRLEHYGGHRQKQYSPSSR